VVDRVENWNTVVELFTRRLGEVEADQWAAPTPCSEWDVRSLVEHAIDYQRGYGRFLGAGPGIETKLADDPAGAWDDVRNALVAAYGAPGALDRTFDFLVGLADGKVAEQIIVPTLDLLFHTWDLARAIGANEALPPDVCADVLEAMRGVEKLIRIPEWYGPAIEPPPGADVQTQLLSFAGRAV
jgi:uncharacterized protein (TIGR03086 family)